jgi:phenylalanyl-tRNA synthetase alpha chain
MQSQDIVGVTQTAHTAIENSSSLNELQQIEIAYLGRKGKVNTLLKTISHLDPKERSQYGKQVNDLKLTIENALQHKKDLLTRKIIEESGEEKIDVTIPGIKPSLGHIHPITQITEDITRVFEEMGYEIVEGPEVETEHYNFEVLNIPKHHPARDLQDTFWLTNGLLPRTHTSAMQVRVMEKRKPPFKIAVPGWVFRSEREDATHAASFHHYEGFVVGDDISFSDLKGTLITMLKMLLGEELQVKFRASYFPYVEPCAEVSVSCPHCKTKGCKACGGSGWLEIMGSGMIHPVVLQNAKIDPKRYSGFAYVFGTTRLAMIKYRINDIRLFTGGDMRFLEQF